MDWLSLLFNVFWIFGAAVLLAATSYHYWLAQQINRSLREQLNEPSYTRLFWISLLLICIGLAGTGTRVWETAVCHTLFTIINTESFKASVNALGGYNTTATGLLFWIEP